MTTRCSRYYLSTLLVLITASSSAHANDANTDIIPSNSFWSQNHHRYYYNPDEVGAHAFYNPLSMIVEGGFGALYDEKLHEFDFQDGAKKLGYTFAHPFELISEYGWKKFFWYEFIPHTGKGSNWTPNWNWHLIGGGFRTRLLEEYFIHHGYEHPKLYAWLTAYSFHLINELLQAQKFDKGSTDAIADLFFFDWIGKIIFQIDFVNRIASKRLHLTDWTYQSLWNPLTNSLVNNGQLYWARLHVWGPLSLSVLTGEMINSLNVTMHHKQHQFSAGFGLKPGSVALNDEGDAVADTMRYNVCLVYSQDDNPVVVATYEFYTLTYRDDQWQNVPIQDPNADKPGKLMINLYPGWFNIKGYEPGVAFIWEGDMVFLGISMGRWPLGFGLSNLGFISLK